jgi:hypothetical protein
MVTVAPVERRLREFAPETEIYFERIAVTAEQIRDWKLPTRPTKKSTHSKGFPGRSVEVDAIPPNTLRALIRSYIESYIDKKALQVMQVAEENERKILETVLGQLESY